MVIDDALYRLRKPVGEIQPGLVLGEALRRILKENVIEEKDYYLFAEIIVDGF